ncbi:MAG: VWA domain-containing protein, partial [Oscillospiraceae bacterium]|nr:VWA domain-containing protein [Oscillospiraceae bacterium]
MKRTLKKVTSIFLALILMYSTMGATVQAPLDALGLVTDPITAALSNDPAEMGFTDILQGEYGSTAGRIWTDKSVRPAANQPAGAPADAFDVTLSALSQDFTFSQNFAIPADTVFIIDLSGSMYTSGVYIQGIGTRTRIWALVESLNQAILILMRANPHNRVAVVGYGGQTGGIARREQILPLGRYSIMGDAESNSFFSLDKYTVDQQPWLTVNPNIQAALAPDPAFPVNINRIRIEGSTPTQWGIYEGAHVLTQNTDRTITVSQESGPDLTFTRRPNIILMTDGEPTLGWTDWQFSHPPAGASAAIGTPGAPDLGDGSYGEIGIGLLTTLTAAYYRRAVQDWYAQAVSENQSDVAVHFFTLGLGDSTDPAFRLVEASMQPFIRNQTSNNTPGFHPADNVSNAIRGPGGMNLPSSSIDHNPLNPDPTMGAVLRSVAQGGTPQFRAQHRVSMGNYTWQTMTTSNSTLPLTLADMAFADDFFPATDLSELEDAFNSITDNINVTPSIPITNARPGDESFDGWLTFSDVLGEYMTFRGVDGVEWNGNFMPRAEFGDAIINNTGYTPSTPTDPDTGTPSIPGTPGIRDKYEDILWRQLNYGTAADDPLFVSKSQVTALVQANIDVGNLADGGRIVYYADADRNFVGLARSDGSPPDGAAVRVELFPMWGEVDSPMGTFDGLPVTIDLMHIALHVVTALQGGTFGEVYNVDSRQLSQHDQMVRWYIPASVIPLRYHNGEFWVNTSPIRVTYTVGLDTERITRDGLSEDYRDRHRVPQSGNAEYPHTYYFYSNRHWITTSGTVDRQNVTLSFYQPHERNPFYQANILGPEDAVIKTDNPTDTAVHVMYPMFMLINQLKEHWLGNNGRLTIRWEPSKLLITKDFAFFEYDDTPVDSSQLPVIPDDFATPLFFTISGPEGFEDMTVTFPGNAPGPTFTFNNNANRWELLLEDIPSGLYVISESGGHISGFSPGSAIGAMDAADVPAGMQGEVNFTNRYRRIDYDSALIVRKLFAGLSEEDVYTLLSDFQIIITDPNGDLIMNNGIPYFDLDAVLTGIYIENPQPGTYTVNEANANVDGFFPPDVSVTVITNGTAENPPREGLPQSFEVPNPNTAHENILVEVVIENTYNEIPPPGSLTIIKNFSGLPANIDPATLGITFDVVGHADGPNIGDVVFQQITIPFADFVDGQFTLYELPWGYYTVAENTGNVPDSFELTVTPSLTQSIYVTDGTEPFIVTFNNVYNEIPPPPPPTEPPPTEPPPTEPPPTEPPPTEPPPTEPPPTEPPPTEPPPTEPPPTEPPPTEPPPTEPPPTEPPPTEPPPTEPPPTEPPPTEPPPTEPPPTEPPPTEP